MDIYGGAFLPQEMEEFWTFSLRERIRSRFLQTVEKLGDYLEEIGDLKQAIIIYQRVLDVDDIAEGFYRRLMICYHLLNQREKALLTYERCKKVLSAVLDAEPSQETQTLFKSLTE